MRVEEKYEPVDELPVIQEIQKIMQYTKHLEEEIIRVTERKKWI